MYSPQADEETSQCPDCVVSALGIKRYSKSLLQYYGDIIIAIIMGIS